MSWQSKKNIPSVKTVARPLLDNILRRNVGFGADFIENWVNVVGEVYAKSSYPVKIAWSKKSKNEYQPATLVVACSAAAELYLQHMTSEICDRVNVFFGYHAIDRVSFKKVTESSLEKRYS